MIVKHRTDLVVDEDLAIAGEPGRDGLDGRDGDPGRDGVDGRAGEPGRGWSYRGKWSSSRQYNESDVVTADGSSFVCLKEHRDREPPNRRFWGVVATAGQDGRDGERGLASKGVKGDTGESAATDTVATADSPMAIGDVVYVSGADHVDLAQAHDRPMAFAFGMVTSVKGSVVKYRTNGVVENPDWSLTPQTVYYLSPTVPGGLTSTYPTASGQFVVIVGVATSPTQLALNIHWMLEQS